MSSRSGHPAGCVQLRYRRADGEFTDTTLERVVVDDLLAGFPVREFRWYKGRRHYSGWYWSSTMGRLKVDARRDQVRGEGVVPRPSPATAYRRLAELTKGTNAVSGSAKGRRSIADGPKGVYGRLRAMRPGEYAILDTQATVVVG